MRFDDALPKYVIASGEQTIQLKCMRVCKRNTNKAFSSRGVLSAEKRNINVSSEYSISFIDINPHSNKGMNLNWKLNISTRFSMLFAWPPKSFDSWIYVSQYWANWNGIYEMINSFRLKTAECVKKNYNWIRINFSFY